MSKNTKTVVGSVFLALGLFSNDIYGSMPREERIKNELALAKNPKEAFNILKEERIDLSFTCNGQTVLFMTRKPNVIKWFLGQNQGRNEFDVNSQDNYKNSVLHHLVEWFLNAISDCVDIRRETEEFMEIAKILYEHGANPLLKNSDGKTACQIIEDDMEIEEGIGEPEDQDEKENLEKIKGASEEMVQILRSFELLQTEREGRKEKGEE